MYYAVDRTGRLQGAAVREGKTVTEILKGDAWEAYEREKTFWIWQEIKCVGPDEQIIDVSESGWVGTD